MAHGRATLGPRAGIISIIPLSDSRPPARLLERQVKENSHDDYHYRL
ncbi:hypothetical protein PMI11_03315 [Rhizobium sp. CF142]|jgi:hypothetical protein|nr:hypothetical protein PMI11_03315 [Rhizobium sp. CF142]